MKVFITGDRSMGPLYPTLVAVEMLKATALGATIVTGENDGVESCVRAFAELAGLEVETVAGGKAEFDERHGALKADNVPVVVIHTEPHASSVYRSLATIMGDDDLRLVTHADLIV